MPLRIVLADDHHIVRQGLRVLLEREGLQVVAEATDGREAVTLAHTHKPDVVVLDLMMPLLNGLEAGTSDRGGAESRDSRLLVEDAGGGRPRQGDSRRAAR